MIAAPNFKSPLLVIGGAKSGKSAYAESLFDLFPAPYTYIATAQPLDDEMVERVRLHRERRKEKWQTIECPFDLPATLGGLAGMKQPVLVDCITLWLSNLLCFRSADPVPAVEDLCAAVKGAEYPLVIVSNETGCGIVPESPLARQFRDLAGSTNQKLAHICSSVIMVVAGLPMQLK